MKRHRLGRREFVWAGSGLLAAATPARGQRPLRILVGFSAGGSTDAAARIIAAKLQELSGAPTIVENKPGASGTIATEAAARAAPDGSVMVLAAMTSTVMAKLTLPTLGYDPQIDLAPIGHVATFQLALAVNNDVPARNVTEFVTWAKASKTPISFGVPGLGGHSHFFGVMLGKDIDVSLQPVPYKGAAPLVTDLAGGQIPVGVSAVSDFLAAHQGGKVRLIGTSGATRSPSTPEIPTFAESGHPGLTSVGWIALYAPGKTPRSIVETISAEIATILALPDVRDRLLALGMEPYRSTPDELAAFDDKELRRWRPIVQATTF